MNRRGFLRETLTGSIGTSLALARPTGLADSPQSAGRQRRNIIFILTDDHRYDAMGFAKGQPWLDTPVLDSLASDGVHFRNAFVTTSLCSPSRATILTGVYAHKHGIVDNNAAIPRDTQFFPHFLQDAGYSTAFIGKWHMGEVSAEPQPGFDHWVSFRGQGNYLPTAEGLNVNGKSVPQNGYITDELTKYAVQWLNSQNKEKPYFLYLSHKAVHSHFEPPPKYRGKYKECEFVYPPTMAATGKYAQDRPMWVQNQRNSHHGVDYPYHSSLNVGDYYKRYMETLGGVEDSIAAVLEVLRQRGELDSTLIIYMGDNGFQFGEHGLIDKRTAYEESMRIPLIARCPEIFGRGKTVDALTANLDIMPTILDAAGLVPPAWCDGKSLLPLSQQAAVPGWRKELLYEYYWERNYPQTPTIHALRGDRYKFIRYQGIWDIDELYDLAHDPIESRNLIFSPDHQALILEMRGRLFDLLENSKGMRIPMRRDATEHEDLRNPLASHGADFPPQLYLPPRK